MPFSGNMLGVNTTVLRKSAGLLGMVLIVFTVSLRAQEPQCTSLTFPVDMETDVPVNSEIRWNPVPNATRYFLVMASSSEVADTLDLGSDLSYRPPSGLQPNTTYFVTIIPNNNSGDAIGCPEESFTTGAGGVVPGCVTLLYPENGTYGISPATDISWFPQAVASGYLLAVGTSSMTMDILPEQDVGNVTSFDLPDDLPFLQQIYVRITPYNQLGEQAVCTVRTFRTRGNNAPLCTEILDPRDGSDFVSVTSNITWIREFNAEGYRMTIEENTPGGLRLLDNADVGGGTNFKPPDFKANTTYFITLIPYNDLGEPQVCMATSFTTGDAPPPPDCSNLLSPADGATGVSVDATIEWEGVPGARGYLLSAGTAENLVDIVNRLDLGLVTNYTMERSLPEGTRVFYRVIPYNNWEEANNCPQWSFITIVQQPMEESLSIPKFFTPNNDGYNDSWVVRSTPDVLVSRVWIFNRFGKLLKQLETDQSWDGSFNGRPLASDSYWYRIETTDGGLVSGYFLLKR